MFAQKERTDPLYTYTHQATHNGMLIKTWSSQAWKSDELMDNRTVRPVVCSQRAHQFVIEDDETESELSLGSGSFLHMVITFCDMGNVYVFNIASICVHGEELLRQIGIPSKIQKISR